MINCAPLIIISAEGIAERFTLTYAYAWLRTADATLGAAYRSIIQDDMRKRTCRLTHAVENRKGKIDRSIVSHAPSEPLDFPQCLEVCGNPKSVKPVQRRIIRDSARNSGSRV